MPRFHLVSHAGSSSQCSQDRARDWYNDLCNELCCLFLTHNFLLSFLIPGAAPRLMTAPKFLIAWRLIVTGWARDDTTATAWTTTAVIGSWTRRNTSLGGLLGCGDLIYSTPIHTIKVQSPTVSKREIKRVTDYIKENKKELYVERLRHFPKATDLEE